MLAEHSERKTLKHERSEKVITSAVKQSLKAYHPTLSPLTRFRDVVTTPFSGLRLIAHCDPAFERCSTAGILQKGGDVMILIGPEGDFSPEEIKFALANGFRGISLGESRLRTETAAVAAVIQTAFVNQ